MEAFGFGEDGVGFGAGVKPEFVATFGGDFGEDFEEDLRADVDGDFVGPGGDFGDGFVNGEAFDVGFGGVYGVNGVALLLEGANGFVSPFGTIAGSADDRDGWHIGEISGGVV